MKSLWSYRSEHMVSQIGRLLHVALLTFSTSNAAQSTQISESALLIRGRNWSCKIGLGSRKGIVLPKHVF